MAQPLSFRWDEDFIARIDKARGDIPRSRFVRRAVEQWLLRTYVEDDPDTVGIDRAKLAEAGRRIAAVSPDDEAYAQALAREIGGTVSTDAAGRRTVVHPRSSAESKRDVRPIPKGGK